MENIKLYNLIKYIQNGTNLHIGVLFLGNYWNKMCELPRNHIIHTAPICETIKNRSKTSYKKCFFCRNLALKKAITTKEPFGGICINGIYEYTHPVVVNNEVACIIFIGNILHEDGYHKISKKISDTLLFNTMEEKLGYNDIVAISKLLENHILFLLDKFSYDNTVLNPLIENIKNYIHLNLECIDVQHIAKQFHYNKTYLGRLFKKETDTNIKDYINLHRIEKAKSMLVNTDETIISIAYKIGFNNVTYFNKVFKSFMSVTPSQYRNLNKPSKS
ncbi:MAG: helix-turn-helix domain-containing protein [Clostridia bacterium]|nr:helix-turn-helix domain-containing protein [Clostridia bacterium]